MWTNIFLKFDIVNVIYFIFIYLPLCTDDKSLMQCLLHGNFKLHLRFGQLMLHINLRHNGGISKAALYDSYC